MNVTAIVVTYNGMQWVDRCLGSLRASLLPVRTIVVDNGSTDGTPAHIEQHFPEVELVRAERNLGFGQANNRGMRMALDRGDDHVFLLNQDAWVRPDTIGRLVERAAAEPGHGVLSPLHLNGAGDALDLAFSNFIIPQRCPGLYSDLALGRAAGRTYVAEFVNAAAWLITRQCLLTVGGFNPTFFHYSEDDDYLHRLHFHGLKCGIVPAVTVHHDREERKENPYFDLRVWRIRKLKLRFADPSKDHDPAAERRKLWFDLLRGLLALRKGEVLVARDQLKMHTEADLASVVRTRELSRAKGPTFL
ncbi:MAG: glycosyltransferase family 2 protein [Flavobacteriales bacterium]|jgi:GT2 family glycosyltransferase